MTEIEICRWYIAGTITFLILWEILVKTLSNGKVGIAIQCGKWCKKHPILIGIIGIYLGHWFYQMPYIR